MSNFFKFLTKIIVSMLILLIIVISIVLIPKYTIVEKSEYNELVRISEFYSNHLYKSGWNGEFGEYTLRSFDDGASWYSFDYDTLLGHVDSIQPGLLKHLTDWETITKFCEKNGPINENNYKFLEEYLNEVGITIEEK